MNITPNRPVITVRPDSRAPRQHIVYRGTKSIGYVGQTLKCDGGKYYAMYSSRSYGPHHDTLDQAVEDLCHHREQELKKHTAQSESIFDHISQTMGHTYTPGMRQEGVATCGGEVAPTAPVGANVISEEIVQTTSTGKPVKLQRVRAAQDTRTPASIKSESRPTSKVRSDGKLIPISYGKPAPPVKRNRTLKGRKSPELVNGIGID